MSTYSNNNKKETLIICFVISLCANFSEWVANFQCEAELFPAHRLTESKTRATLYIASSNKPIELLVKQQKPASKKVVRLHKIYKYIHELCLNPTHEECQNIISVRPVFVCLRKVISSEGIVRQYLQIPLRSSSVKILSQQRLCSTVNIWWMCFSVTGRKHFVFLPAAANEFPILRWSAQTYRQSKRVQQFKQQVQQFKVLQF